jgi:hypothetical protein
MPETLELLNDARKGHRLREWSLSQEIEDRLRRTLSEDKAEIDQYGSKQNAAIVRLIGLVIQVVSAKGKHDWLKEQWLFDDVMSAIRHVFLWFRPGGDSDIRKITFSSGTDLADQLINEIRSADPSLPITKKSARQHDMARLKDRLRDLVSDRKPYDDLWSEEPRVPSNISNRLKRRLRQQRK